VAKPIQDMTPQEIEAETRRHLANPRVLAKLGKPITKEFIASMIRNHPPLPRKEAP